MPAIVSGDTVQFGGFGVALGMKPSRGAPASNRRRHRSLRRAKIVGPSWFDWPALPVAVIDTIVPAVRANKSFNFAMPATTYDAWLHCAVSRATFAKLCKQ